MRSLLSHMRMAVIAMAACTTVSAAHAASRTQSTDGDGWQPLGSGARKPGVVGQASRNAVTDSNTLVAAASALASSAPEPAVSVTPVSAARPFELVADESVEQQLLEWAKRAGWKVLWRVQDAWVVPGNKSYGDDFESAVQRVTEDLAANGTDVLGDSWRGNHTIIITQNGAAEQ
jgi:hypothetical protein